ncbi:hypothetical protein FRB97_007409 [Tulasnella sp. 331]|nr:hypothetical protein FRB97_007409 [Tulasnella sp. 331]
MNCNATKTAGLADTDASAITNVMQTFLAAAHLNLENFLPNDILVNPSSELINPTIEQSFLGEDGINTLHRVCNAVSGVPVVISETEKFLSAIAAEYQRKMEQRKSADSILVAMSVARLALFKSGWVTPLVDLDFLGEARSV